MRILKKELTKLFSVRLAVLLAFFTVLFIFIFSHWSTYPHNFVNWPGSVPFYAELVKEFGSELSPDEWELFLAKKEQLIQALNGTIEEKELYEINQSIPFDDLRFMIQDCEHIEDAKKYFMFGATEEEAWEHISCTDPESMQKREAELRTREELSLVPGAAIEVIMGDFIRLVILISVWCFAFILPYQIGERLKAVYPILASTRTGRRIFRSQFAASLAVGFLSWFVICAVYTILLWSKDYFVFKDCQISNGWMMFWIDASVLQHLLINYLILLPISLGSAVLAYIIGRISPNYIAGLAISIPAGAAFCLVTQKCTYRLFLLFFSLRVWAVRSAVLIAVLAIFFIAAVMLLRRDRKRDIL